MAIALYARKSVERENSISCETQIDYCRAMIKPDERGEEIVTFIDNGFSGGNTDRDGFRSMMQQVERGKLKKIIVYRLDRISRSLSDFVGILDTLKRHRVQFVSSQESFDTSSPYGEMIVKILMVFAEFERQSIIIERVTQAYAHRSDKGFYMGGRRPYGFTLIETEIHGIRTKKLAPVETEIGQIAYIFEHYAAGGVSLRRLMDHLHQNHILPSDGSWSSAKLSAILRNPIYVRADNAVYEYYRRQNTRIVSDIDEFDGVHGLQIYGKTKHIAEDFSDLKVVVMQHEGVIPSDLWLACQRKLAHNRQVGKTVGNQTSWLGGKLICKLCGRTMTVTKGGKRADGTQTRYFSCTGKSHNRICTGPKVTLYAESLEQMVDTLIAEKLTTLNQDRQTVPRVPSDKLNLLKNQLSEIEKAQENLVSLLLHSTPEADMLALLNAKAKKLAQDKRDICDKIEKLTQEEAKPAQVIHLASRWKTAKYEEKKAVCQLLIEMIYIYEDGKTEVVWKI